MAAKAKPDGKARAPKALSQVKIILRDNFRALLDDAYPRATYRNGRGQLQAFIRKHLKEGWSKDNLSLLQRLRDEGSCNLDTVSHLATTYKLQAYQLFIRGLNVRDPQQAVPGEVIRTIDQLEKARRTREVDGERETSTQHASRTGRPPAGPHHRPDGA